MIMGTAVDKGRMEYLPLEEVAHCLRECQGGRCFQGSRVSVKRGERG